MNLYRPSNIDTSGAPPSRDSNPFATCWTKPGALGYYFELGQSADDLVRALQARHWRGEIIGPHGAGKSTLLHTLVPLIRKRGRKVLLLTPLEPGSRLVGKAMMELLSSHLSEGSLIALDGFEQVPWPLRWSLQRRCRIAGCGLLVTAHRRAGLPLLALVKPSLLTVQHLTKELTKAAPRKFTPWEVADVYHRHRGNVREVFFDLYDRYERQGRKGVNL
jgi:hypothetical protein